MKRWRSIYIETLTQHFETLLPWRYDVFFLRSLLKPVRCAKDLYALLTAKVRETLPKCHIEDFFFEKDEEALRLEMHRSGQAEGLSGSYGLGPARSGAC